MDINQFIEEYGYDMENKTSTRVNSEELLELVKEIQFLQYFYVEAGEAFGPADDEIYDSITQSYDGQLPRNYQ